MRLTSLAMLALGYVLGTRAGRDRYDDLVANLQRAAERLDRS